MGATAYLKESIAENLVRRTPGLYWRFAEVARRAETMSLEERRLLRDELTARTLRHALRTTYARERGLSGDFNQWPVLEKKTLAEDAGVCAARTLFPAHPASTGGTTGIPIKLRRSLASVVCEQAVLDRLVHRYSGLDLKKARLAVLRGDTVKSPDDMAAPHWRLRQHGAHLVCSSHHLNASTIDDFIEAIRRFDPDMLWVYPSSLEAFVRLGADALRARRLPRLKLVLSSSEVLDATVFAAASEILQTPVLDFYGQGERVCASFAVRGGEHYFLPAYGRVELLPVGGDQASELFEIAGTSYWNPAQPLVRFRTGDLARLPRGMNAEEIEAVTLGVLPFLGIEGRSSEYVLSPEGRRLSVLSQIPRNVPDIAQMQIVQKSTSRLEIHVVPLKSFGERSRNVILANARQKIPTSMDIDIRTVDCVMRTRSGKAPLVMRLLD